MGTGQLLIGNLVDLAVTILAFLQVIPWPIAGLLVIAISLLTVLSYLTSRSGHIISPAPVPSPRTNLRQTPSNEEPVPTEKKIVKHSVEVQEPLTKRSAAKTPKEIAETKESFEGEPGDSSTRISGGDYLSFDVNLQKGEEVIGDVSASGNINVYILNEENLTALETDQEFWYEAGSENVQSATLRFTAPEDGDWYLIVENADPNEITATTKVSVSGPSHSVPSLKAEGLELPDARLEGKL